MLSGSEKKFLELIGEVTEWYINSNTIIEKTRIRECCSSQTVSHTIAVT